MTRITRTDRRPNLFLIGAPKTATTSLAAALGRREDVYVPHVKEPNNYNADLSVHWARRGAHFLNLYEGAESGHRYLLDASTLYLYSPVARRSIAAMGGDTKVVIGVRDPVDLLVSWHSHLLRENIERRLSVEEAWEASSWDGDIERPFDYDQMRNYKRIVDLSNAVGAYIDSIRPRRCFIYNMESLITQPRLVQQALCAFLHIDEDEGFSLTNENQSQKRTVNLASAMRLAATIKAYVRIEKNFGILKGVQALFSAPGKGSTVSSPFLQNVACELSNEQEWVSSCAS